MQNDYMRLSQFGWAYLIKNLALNRKISWRGTHYMFVLLTFKQLFVKISTSIQYNLQPTESNQLNLTRESFFASNSLLGTLSACTVNLHTKKTNTAKTL